MLLNRTLLRTLALRSHVQRHPAICIRRLYTQIPFERPFTTSLGTSAQGLPASEGTPENPASRMRSFRRIRTLDPARLTADDYLDFSSKAQPVFRVVLRSNDGPGLQIRLNVSPSEWSSGMFPPGTRGFLYYHAPPDSTPLAGKLRFRLTGLSRDPASFAAGSDLLTEQGTRWRYPLWKVARRPSYRDLASLLVQDGLVSQRTLDAAEATLSLAPPMISTSPVLSRLGQEFEFRFRMGCKRHYLLAGPEGIVKQSFRFIAMWTVLAHNGAQAVQYYPFKGSAICRFERSELAEHIGRRVAVLRVVRLLDNDPLRHVPAPDGHVFPIEALRPRDGGLVKKMYRGQLQPWSVDVDRNWVRPSTLRRSLRLLFDNDELYGSPQ